MFKLAKVIISGLIGFFSVFVIALCHEVMKKTSTKIKDAMNR